MSETTYNQDHAGAISTHQKSYKELQDLQKKQAAPNLRHTFIPSSGKAKEVKKEEPKAPVVPIAPKK